MSHLADVFAAAPICVSCIGAAIHPMSAGLSLWFDVWTAVARAAGAEPDAGRRLKGWALGAGFKEEDMRLTAGTFCYSTAAERQWWGGLWADRMAPDTNFSKSAVEGGHATPEQLSLMAQAWRDWANSPDATFIMAHGELLVRQ